MIAELKKREKSYTRWLSRVGANPPVQQPFGLDWEQKYLPHYLTEAPSLFHRDLIDDLSTFHLTRGVKKVYRGPRGSGKTSHISKAYPLWAAVENVEPMTLLLAETGPGQSETYLRAIKAELEGNEALKRDYPNACGIGPVWRSERIKLRNGAVIVAKGSGSRILGMTDKATRPTLVIGDDLNARTDAYSPTTRTRRLAWFSTDVMSVGNIKTTNYLIAGTSIHREAVVCALTNNSAWETRGYASIMQWPKNMELWAQWERVASNLGSANRREEALAFYAANKAAMDDGAIVVWPERESIYDLMDFRRAIGPAAFDSEKNDKPGSDGTTEWASEYFDRNDFFFNEWPDDILASVLAIDPSKGASDKSDFQAFAMVGVSRKDGTIYAEMFLGREDVTAMVGRSLDIAKGFKPSEICVEENGTMGMILPEYNRQMIERGQIFPLMAITQTEAKVVRIRGLTGYLARSQLRIRNTHSGKLTVEQMRDFPSGANDDGPDALALAVKRLEVLLS